MITRPFKTKKQKKTQTVEVFSVTDPRLLYFKWHTGWRVTSHTSLWVFILSSGLNLTLCMLWSDEWGIWKFTDRHTNNTSFLMNGLLRWGSSSAKDQWWSSTALIYFNTLTAARGELVFLLYQGQQMQMPQVCCFGKRNENKDSCAWMSCISLWW